MAGTSELKTDSTSEILVLVGDFIEFRAYSDFDSISILESPVP